MVPLSCLVHRSARGRSGKTTTTDHRFNIGSESCLCETGYGRLLAGVGGRLRGGTGNILVGGTRQRGLHRQFARRGNDPTALWTCKGRLGATLARRRRRCHRDLGNTDELELDCESAIGSVVFFRDACASPEREDGVSRADVWDTRKNNHADIAGLLYICYEGTWLRAGRGDAVTRRSLGGKVRRHRGGGGGGGAGGRAEG